MCLVNFFWTITYCVVVLIKRKADSENSESAFLCSKKIEFKKLNLIFNKPLLYNLSVVFNH